MEDRKLCRKGIFQRVIRSFLRLIVSSGEKLLRASLRLGPVVHSGNKHCKVFVQIIFFSACYCPVDNDKLISSSFSVGN